LHGKRAIVVDDAINAGAATLPCVRDVEQCGASVVAAAALLLRSHGAPELLAGLGIPVEYLAGLRWNTWSEDGCPLCRRSWPPLESPA
jgi:orotate phosphoribosyltransferase